MSKRIHNPHDKLFRASMQYPSVVKEFLEFHLPDFMLHKINLNSITACQNTFIDEELQLLQSDVLLKAKLVSEQEIYLYILSEHQKKPDKLMAFRLLKYMIKIWELALKEKSSKEPLPLPVIYPLVFFTGSGPYNVARAIWELCGDYSELMQSIWCSLYNLVDVNKIPEEQLISRRWSGTVEFIMRNKFKQHLTREIKKIASSFDYLLNKKDGQLVLELLSYILDIDNDHHTMQELTAIIQDQLSPNLEDKIMSLADKLRSEGLNQGLNQGMHQGQQNEKIFIAKRMLSEGADEEFVARITQLSIEMVRKLKLEKN